MAGASTRRTERLLTLVFVMLGSRRGVSRDRLREVIPDYAASASEQAFERMRDIGMSLAASMDGSLTDQEGAPLSAAALDHIAAELHKLYALLDEREFAAGSSLARRLFS